jgi:tetratricopeptide (TPR) repeat protein
MPIRPEDFATGGALLGGVAASLLAQVEGAQLPAAGQRIGPFRVVDLLGHGGMAAVFRAERDDGEYRQTVALKWIAGASHGEASRELFRRERQALADLNHPHIARLLDGGHSADGQPWLAMELIDGDPIDADARRRGLSLDERLRLFLQVCAAVSFAHARGLLHRDIKPNNVLVDAGGQAKLLDFGIVQLLGEDDALAAGAHTPGYASPEQRRGERLTVAADVFQLGRLLERLLARDSEQAERLTLAATSESAPLGSPQPSSTRLPELPFELRALIARATASDAAQRYSSVDALAEDVRAFLDRRPLQAMGSGTGYRLRKFLQRHRAAVLAASAALLVLVATAVVSAQRIRTERDLAERERRAAEAINTFLNDDVLDAANPLRRAPGAPDVTVREALDAAGARVTERLRDQPEIAMRVLTTLGRLRHEFGDYDAGLALLDQAIALGAERDLDPVGRLAAEGERAALLITLQRFDEAEAALQNVVVVAGVELGEHSFEHLQWQLRLLEARGQQSQLPQPLDDLEALRLRANRALGEPNAVAAEADLIAANTLRFHNRPADAALPARRALEGLRAVFGADHPTTLKAQMNVGHVQQSEGRTAEAIATIEAAWKIQIARYGRANQDSLFIQNELGYLLFVGGEFERAEQVFVELAETRREMFGEHSPEVFAALSNLLGTRVRLGYWAAARETSDRLQRIAIGPADIGTPQRVGALRLRAEMLLGLGELAASAASLDEAQGLADGMEPEDLRRLALDGVRARWLIASGDSSAGRALLQQTLQAMRAQVPDTHPFIASLLAATAG